MNKVLSVVLVAACVAVAGCALTSSAGQTGEPGGREPALTPTGAANLVLYVSNQSFVDDSVDLRVAVDGAVVVADTFLVEGQHTWIEYPLSLPAGSHTLSAESATAATLTQNFELPRDGIRWAVLSYWYDPDGTPREFTFTIHDQPVGFD